MIKSYETDFFGATAGAYFNFEQDKYTLFTLPMVSNAWDHVNFGNDE